jgi:DNA repair exonuclease SbcCD nuclease subunit
VPAVNICERLRDYFLPKAITADLVVIGGDITDKAMGLGENATRYLIGFFIDLFTELGKRKIPIVLLRGTISHDREHLKVLKEIHDCGNFGNTLYYVDTLSLGTIPECDLKVLYIPDDLPFKTSDAAIAVVKEQMAERGWDAVDYVFFHGYFQHALPEGIPAPPHCTFSADQFGFVKRAVLCGHVHTRSQHKNVFYNGSFDRLRHGEEEEKGFLYVKDNGKDLKVTFVENARATPFVTIDLTQAKGDVTEAYRDRIKPLLKHASPHVRIIHPDTEIRRGLVHYTTGHYPTVSCSHMSLKRKASDSKTPSLFDAAKSELEKPTRENLPDMIYRFLEERGKPLSVSRIKQHLG